MFSFRFVWWLIQINAVLWFLLLGFYARHSESLMGTVLPMAGLIIAALLEYAAINFRRNEEKGSKKQ